MSTLIATPAPQSTATGDASLNSKLGAWVAARPGERFVARDTGVYSDGRPATICLLVDRGIERVAASPIGWEDAVRNALTVAAWADFFEQRTGEQLPAEGILFS